MGSGVFPCCLFTLWLFTPKLLNFFLLLFKISVFLLLLFLSGFSENFWNTHLFSIQTELGNIFDYLAFYDEAVLRGKSIKIVIVRC